MKPQVISFVTPIPLLMERHWYDRIRNRLINWLGGIDPRESLHVRRVVVDADTFMGRLYKQQAALFESFHRDASQLLIGAEEFESLMNEPAINQAFSFQAQYNRGRYAVCGLQVTVIPWMRGMLVMP